MSAERGFALRLLGKIRGSIIAGWKKGLQLPGLDREGFLCPAKNVSVMEFWRGKKVKLVDLENEPEKISERERARNEDGKS